MTSPADVLVIDDHLHEAEGFAGLIEAGTGLRADATADPGHAEELVRLGGIKVAVIDQKLDGSTTNGTALFTVLHQIDPDLRGILFSGQYSGREGVQAVEDGMTVLDKDRLEELPSAVTVAYASYLRDMAVKARNNPAGTITARQRFFRPRSVKYEVLTVSPAALGQVGEIVLPGSYETFLKLDAGQEERARVANTTTETVVIERESVTKLETGVGANVHLAKIQESVQTAIQLRESRETATTETVEQQRVYKLPPDSQQGAEPTVRARHFQAAIVYRKERALVRISCDCCGVRLEVLDVLVPTGRHRTRQVDFLSDNEQRTVDTG